MNCILVMGQTAGRGLTFHLTHFANALRKANRNPQTVVKLGSTQGELSLGTWEFARSVFPPEDIMVFQNDAEDLALQLSDLIGRFQKIIIHCGGWRQVRIVSRLRRKYPKKVKVVVTTHSFRNGTFWRIPVSAILGRYYETCVDYVVFQCNDTVASFFGSSRLFRRGIAGVIPLGAEKGGEKDMQLPEASPGVPDIRSRLEGDDCFRVVYLAQLERHKGHRWLLNGLANVMIENRRLQVLFLGEGTQFALIHKQAEDLGVSEQLVMPGVFLPRATIPWILSRCHVAVVASRCETFGHCFLEPMTAGLPVIGTRTGVGRDLIQDYLTGFGIAWGDANGVTRAVRYCVTYPEHARQMGEEAMKRTRSTYTWENVAAAHLRLYQSLLGQ